jgi:hypothetical protein
LYKLIGNRELSAVKVGARTFVLQSSIDEFVAKLSAEAEEPIHEDSEQASEAEQQEASA